MPVTDHQLERFRILCIRSGASVCGPGRAYMKSNGKEMIFNSRAEAEAELARVKTLYGSSSNVWHTLEKMDDA